MATRKVWGQRKAPPVSMLKCRCAAIVPFKKVEAELYRSPFSDDAKGTGAGQY